jgi:catechol 2,3-dioxygenase-like lactoylglutathione lyase family enzyme
MKFTSNRDIAIKVSNLKTAINFYEKTLGFKPSKTESKLRVYNTGHFKLYVQEGTSHPPVPSFTVKSLAEAKNVLTENGCTIIVEREKSLYFKDPTGVLWDIIEE